MVREVVRRARRRLLWNEVLSQGSWVLAVAFGGVILLLLLGTQILDWYWLVAFPLVTLGWCAHRLGRRLPSDYRTAQLVDARLRLADSLSTALYFSRLDPPEPGSERARATQRAQADAIARTVDISRAVPFTMPNAVYAMALLGMVASSLFALRYGLERRLDLRPPLARLVMDSLGFGDTVQAAQVKKERPKGRRPPEKVAGVSVTDERANGPGELDPASDAALDTTGEPNLDNSNAVTANASSDKKDDARPESGKTGDAVEDAQSSQPGNDQGSQGKSSQPAQSASAAQQSGSPGENSSLMNKFRDAMQNLLSRMRQQPGASAGSRQQASNGQNGQPGKAQAANNGQQGSQQGQKSGAAQSDSQDGQPGADQKNAMNAMGKGSGQSGDQQTTQQPGSGIGRQDGGKDVKLAEQLAAMGKISEIIGKRSANLTGEVTMEVQSSSQQLRTPYAERRAQHTDNGAEISRDEVPVALQQYVQQYFEQVRKLAPEAPRRAGPGRGPRGEPR